MKAFFNSLAQVGFFLLAVALLVFVIGLGTPYLSVKRIEVMTS
jgi:hypothetical protein